MLRGKQIFRCPKCGKIFISVDIEYGATALSQPMTCPKCKTLSATIGQNRTYKKIGIIPKDK